jgi:anti-anti-sigma factor
MWKTGVTVARPELPRPTGNDSQGIHGRIPPDGKPAMRNAKHLFDVELRGETAIVSPVGNLRELDCLDIEAGQKEVLAFLDHTRARNVVLDLSRMDYSGSTALGFFIRLSARVKSGNGRMAVCNVSEHENEIFRLAHLDRLWPILPSKEEALQAVTG